MNDNSNDNFVTSVLCIGTAVYIAVCAMALGGLVATRSSASEVFLDFTKDYGTLIAGIPVLVAVIVAKQQLDANRRQHIANVKRSFQKEVVALEAFERYGELSKAVLNLSFDDDVSDYAEIHRINKNNFDTLINYKGILLNNNFELFSNDILNTTGSLFELRKMRDDLNAAINAQSLRLSEIDTEINEVGDANYLLHRRLLAESELRRSETALDLNNLKLTHLLKKIPVVATDLINTSKFERKRYESYWQ